MNGRTLLIAALALVVGAAAGFLLANAVNRNELSILTAEVERLKSERTATPPSGPELSDEEIAATIRKADQNPGDFATQRNIGMAMYQYGAMKKDSKLIAEAARLLTRASELAPGDYDVIVGLGNANFDIGYFEKNNDSLAKARRFYQKALATKPDDVEVRTDVGLTYFLQTPPDLDKAAVEFRSSLAKNPKHEKTLQFLIQTLAKQENRNEAAKYLEQLRAVNHNNQSIAELTSIIAGAQPAG